MIENKTILIFGGSGSLGNELTKRYIANNNIAIFSRSENNQFLMKKRFHSDLDNIEFIIGDVVDKEKVKYSLTKFQPDIVIIASAMKHIDICEENINSCIDINIRGTTNIVDSIVENYCNNINRNLEVVCYISTDKACSPVNTYGMSKAISERINIDNFNTFHTLKFVNVRYGNVLESRGSLIPVLKDVGNDNTKQYFSVTDKNMTRFFMTLDDSIDLIEYAILNAESGDTVIPKHIKCFNIYDIVEYFSQKYNKPIKVTGIRPGEKLHENLVCFTESLRLVENDDYYLIKHVSKNSSDYNVTSIKDNCFPSNRDVETDLSFIFNNMSINF